MRISGSDQSCSGCAAETFGIEQPKAKPVFDGSTVRNGGGGQRRDRTADAGLFRAALYH